MKKIKFIFKVSLFSIFIILQGCPSLEKDKRIQPRLGERSDYDSSRNVLEIVSEPDEGQNTTTVKTEDIEPAVLNRVNKALDKSLESPARSSADCGMEEPDVFQSGKFRDRFDAVKKIANYIMEEGQVSDMDQVSFKDKNSFCPKYDTFDQSEKRDFWATLLGTMAIYESNIRPDVKYDEGQTSTRLAGVTSRGLVQMSYNSAKQKRYVANGCRLESPQQLHIPHVNLRCALAALKTLVKADGCLACDENKGGARYWSTLREPYQVKNRKTGKWVKIGKKRKVIDDLKKYKPNCF